MRVRRLLALAGLLLFSGSISHVAVTTEQADLIASPDWKLWSTASTAAGVAATPVVLSIDAGARGIQALPRLPGVVMQVINESSPTALAQDLGLSAGRYATFGHNHKAHNMPECWSGASSDYEALDAQIAKGFQGGLNPRLVHLQLLYVSPCDVVEEARPVLEDDLLGIDGLRLSKAYYPTLTSAAIATNREAIKDMLHDQVRHTVETWRIHRFTVWNEPDVLYPIPLNVYMDYYTLVNEVLRDVERETGRDLRIGGPVTAYPDEVWIRALLDHVVANDLDLDEVVFHAYAKGSTNIGTTSSKYADQIDKVRSWIAAAQADRPDLDPEVHINEWGYDAFASDPTNTDGAGAAFVASTLTAFADARLDAADYFSYQDPRQPEGTNCPTGMMNHAGYGLLDCHDVPRPAYHAFRFFNSLGHRRVDASPASEVVQGRQEWGGLAMRHEDGSLRVLLRNWDPSRAGLPVSVTLEIEGFDVGSWSAEEIGLSTGGQITTSSGEGVPDVLLPPNQAVFLVLRPTCVDCR